MQAKALDSPLIKNPEPGPAVSTIGVDAPTLNLSLRETIEAMDKLLARLYSLLG